MDLYNDFSFSFSIHLFSLSCLAICQGLCVFVMLLKNWSKNGRQNHRNEMVLPRLGLLAMYSTVQNRSLAFA